LKESITRNQECIDNQLIEDITQLVILGFGEGAATCQVCASKCREGDVVVAYTYRSAGTVTIRVGRIECADCWRPSMESFTLGVRELVVEARIGRCMDVATQSSWPVLLAPDLRLYSPPASNRAHARSDGNPARTERGATGEACTATCLSASDQTPQVTPLHPGAGTDDYSPESPDPESTQDQPDHTPAGNRRDGR
jgi:hypothetical protein